LLPQVLVVLLLLLGTACTPNGNESRLTFRLLTGTENRSLAPLIETFAKNEGITIKLSYQGSVDTMLDLQEGASQYDAVWPASSIWLNLGDTRRVVSQTKSIMRTPVVFGVKLPIARELGWVGRDVRMEDILAAAESGRIRFMTTSATQSNSGAMAYLGYLYAFAGQPDVLTSEMLDDPEVLERTRRILNVVDRTAGASGFLRDLFLQRYDDFDGMFNNESAIITANLQLTAEGRDPLYVVYPVDGLAIADWPLGFVDHGEEEKAGIFTRFQEYLLSADIQAALLAEGRRTDIGLNPVDPDPAIFNPAWGIDPTRVIDPITIPPPDVIMEALTLYQTVLRKPSFTVYLLDYSGSMDGDAAEDLEAAMTALLDPAESARYLLQPSAQDVTIVIPFNDGIIDQWRVEGNDPDKLLDLLSHITALDAGGGTNIYKPVIAALDALDTSLDGYAPAIILMTDGQSQDGSFGDVEGRLELASGQQIPIYPILFGDTDEEQVTVLAEATSGRVFDGRTDLIAAFRQAKGYN
jgi:Ca-activated chloride channel family protein